METTEQEYIDVLLPGFIEANNNMQFGEPCLVGTRIPFSAGWVWEELERQDREGHDPRLIRENVIALMAFKAGYDWHRSRARRKRMEDAVTELWERINREGPREARPRR